MGIKQEKVTMAADGLAGALDVVIPSGAYPLDAAETLRVARDEGCRSVRAPRSIAPAAAKALRGTGCAVASACESTVGLLGSAVLAWTAQDLSGSGLDELDIPVEAGMLASDSATVLQLRRVSALCHAHGMLADAVASAAGLTVEKARAFVRAVVEGSADLMTLAAPEGGAVPVELVAAAVDEARGRVRIRVAGGVRRRAEVERLVNLGVLSVEVSAEELEALLPAILAA